MLSVLSLFMLLYVSFSVFVLRTRGGGGGGHIYMFSRNSFIYTLACCNHTHTPTLILCVSLYAMVRHSIFSVCFCLFQPGECLPCLYEDYRGGNTTKRYMCTKWPIFFRKSLLVLALTMSMMAIDDGEERKEQNTRNRLKILLALFVFGNSFSLSLSLCLSSAFKFFFTLAGCWLAMTIRMRDDCWSAQSQVSFLYGSYSKHRRIKCWTLRTISACVWIYRCCYCILLLSTKCFRCWRFICLFFPFYLIIFDFSVFSSLSCNYLISSAFNSRRFIEMI